MIIYRLKTVFLVALFVVVSCCLLAKEYTAGIIVDSSTANSVRLIANLDSELRTLAGFSVNIKDSNIKSGDNNPDKINQLIKEHYQNADIDLVIAIGPLTSQILATQDHYAKPSFAANIINSSIQNIPRDENFSSVSNFNYIDFEIDFNEHFESFRDIVPFQQAVLLLNKCLTDSIDGIKEKVQNLAKQIDLRLEVVGVDDSSIHDAAAKISSSQAVFTGPMLDLSQKSWSVIIDATSKNKIPSKSILNKMPADNGLFAASMIEELDKKLARRLALSIQRLSIGHNLANFRVDFVHPYRMVINMDTARTIGVFPTWEQMIDAKLLNEEPSTERLLSITEVIEKSVVRNLQLAAKNQEIYSKERSVERARSHIRPHLNVFAHQGMIDNHRAKSMMGPARFNTAIGAQLRYVINSEQVAAGIDLEKIMQNALLEEERALILDIINDASLAYLSVLQAKTLQRIQQENLEVTRANLNLAKLREEAGRSSPAEIFRWEIEMANAREAIIRSSALRKKAELSLNQILSASQEEEFSTADCDIFSQVFFLDYLQIAPYMDNPQSFRTFRDFLVEDTFASSPELKQMASAIEAQQRLHLKARRKYRNPDVAIEGNFQRTVRESGTGDVRPAMPPPFSDAMSAPEQNEWYVGLSVSLPLHDGGNRPAAIKQYSAEIEKLLHEREYLMQRLELNTRATLEDARASFSSISLAQTRAEYAKKSLEVVQEAYSTGAVDVLDLLDAQNAALQANEASTNAVFEFLSDFVRVCRAVGTFDFMLSHEDNRSWYQRLDEYYKAKGQENITRRQRRPGAVKLFETPSDKKVLYREIPLDETD